MISKINKTILNVLQRIHSEKGDEARKALSRMSELAHQLQHFNSMKEVYQREVIRDMFEDMKHYYWDDWMKEVKDVICVEGEQ